MTHPPEGNTGESVTLGEADHFAYPWTPEYCLVQGGHDQQLSCVFPYLISLFLNIILDYLKAQILRGSELLVMPTLNKAILGSPLISEVICLPKCDELPRIALWRVGHLRIG